MTQVRSETMPSIREARKSPLRDVRVRHANLEISLQWPTFDVALVSVAGEVDTANSAELLEYTMSKALLCRLLILNLERVTYLSSSGYDMVRTLRRRCAMAEVQLTVLHGTYESPALSQ
jgi:anti-anti-sigma factor